MGGFCSCEDAKQTVQQIQEDIDERGLAAVAQDKVVAAATAVEQKLDGLVADAEAAQPTAPKDGTSAAETPCATLDAAMAVAATGAMTVEFVDGKGAVQKVDFKAKKLGFTCALSGGGCCSGGKAKVVVKKVDKGGQAATLGVQSKWTIRTVNSTEVTGNEQAQKLMTECEAKLPEA